LIAAIAVIGLIISMIEYEVIISSLDRQLHEIDVIKPIRIEDTNLEYAQKRLVYSESDWTRVISLILSVIGLACLLKRYNLKSKWQNRDLPFQVSDSRVLNDLDFSHMILE
jgi:hypothetical protein